MPPARAAEPQVTHPPVASPQQARPLERPVKPDEDPPPNRREGKGREKGMREQER
jgi:hypothetical protein